MTSLRRIAKQIPGAAQAYRLLRTYREIKKARQADRSGVFSSIYEEWAWPGKESVSGPGSDLDQTQIVMRELPVLFKELGTSSLLDLPCGDFHWMCDTDLGEIRYVGADIVENLIRENMERFQGPNRTF